jgi:hypothetical protein
MPHDSSLPTCLAMQLAFVFLLFKLYRELTGTKDATIVRKEAEVRTVEAIVRLKEAEIASRDATIARNEQTIAAMAERIRRLQQNTEKDLDRRRADRRRMGPAPSGAAAPDGETPPEQPGARRATTVTDSRDRPATFRG